MHGSDAMNTNQNHLNLFTRPQLRPRAQRHQDTIPDIPATGARTPCLLAAMDDLAITAFTKFGDKVVNKLTDETNALDKIQTK